MISKKECKTISCLERKRHHKYVRHIHRKHRISYKTLFYMKEYGPHSHVASVIIKESIKILIIASIISSIGGIGLQSIQEKIITIAPLLILVPALNDMVGDFGTIVSSKFTTMIYMRKVHSGWWKSELLRRLLVRVLIISAVASAYLGMLSYAVAYYNGFVFDFLILFKVISLSFFSSTLLVGLICFISVVGGLYIYHKKEDPNNFLIPITTSIADFGSIAVFSFMVVLFF